MKSAQSLFQSTLPHGERLPLFPKRFYTLIISIHAPAWGATTGVHGETSKAHYFNPRSRMGSDEVLKIMEALGYISIHAPAWGATMLLLLSQYFLEHFNPRSRMGSDIRCDMIYISRDIFQSTLPHGERRKIFTKGAVNVKFQSTLPHGERPYRSRSWKVCIIISIHAPAWGATP